MPWTEMLAIALLAWVVASFALALVAGRLISAGGNDPKL